MMGIIPLCLEKDIQFFMPSRQIDREQLKHKRLPVLRGLHVFLKYILPFPVSFQSHQKSYPSFCMASLFWRFIRAVVSGDSNAKIQTQVFSRRYPVAYDSFGWTIQGIDFSAFELQLPLDAIRIVSRSII